MSRRMRKICADARLGACHGCVLALAGACAKARCCKNSTAPHMYQQTAAYPDGWRPPLLALLRLPFSCPVSARCPVRSSDGFNATCVPHVAACRANATRLAHCLGWVRGRLTVGIASQRRAACAMHGRPARLAQPCCPHVAALDVQGPWPQGQVWCLAAGPGAHLHLP